MPYFSSWFTLVFIYGLKCFRCCGDYKCLELVFNRWMYAFYFYSSASSTVYLWHYWGVSDQNYPPPPICQEGIPAFRKLRKQPRSAERSEQTRRRAPASTWGESEIKVSRSRRVNTLTLKHCPWGGGQHLPPPGLQKIKKLDRSLFPSYFLLEIGEPSGEVVANCRISSSFQKSLLPVWSSCCSTSVELLFISFSSSYRTNLH